MSWSVEKMKYGEIDPNFKRKMEVIERIVSDNSDSPEDVISILISSLFCAIRTYECISVIDPLIKTLKEIEVEIIKESSH
jgi:hypothetical protein